MTEGVLHTLATGHTALETEAKDHGSEYLTST